MVKTMKQKGLAMLMLMFVVVAFVQVSPVSAAYPGDGNYQINYQVIKASPDDTVSSMNAYVTGPAKLVVSSSGAVQTVTVEFSSTSYIDSLSVYNEDNEAYEAVSSVTPAVAGNYAFSFEVANLAELVKIQAHINIPYPVPGFPNGYNVTREARLAFDVTSII